MDPLLADLISKNLGLSIHGLFLGTFSHADDIRTAATNAADSSNQVVTVDRFTKRNGLQLCAEKCGIVITGRNVNEPSLWLAYLLKI